MLFPFHHCNTSKRRETKENREKPLKTTRLTHLNDLL